MKWTSFWWLQLPPLSSMTWSNTQRSLTTKSLFHLCQLLREKEMKLLLFKSRLMKIYLQSSRERTWLRMCRKSTNCLFTKGTRNSTLLQSTSLSEWKDLISRNKYLVWRTLPLSFISRLHCLHANPTSSSLLHLHKSWNSTSMKKYWLGVTVW